MTSRAVSWPEVVARNLAADGEYLSSKNADFDVVYALRPRLALLWNLQDYEASQQRWSAD